MIHFESIQELALQHHEGEAGPPVVCKPEKSAFQLAMRQAGLVDAQDVIFLDDSTRNIQAAHDLGMYSVLVGVEGSAHAGADLAVVSLHELGNHLPHLFSAGTAPSLMPAA